MGAAGSCHFSGGTEFMCKKWEHGECLQSVYEMPSHDVVTWNVMISGHEKCGQGQKALDLF